MAAKAGRRAMRAEAAKVASKAPWTAGKVLRTTGGTLRRGWAQFGEKETTERQVVAIAFLLIPNMVKGSAQDFDSSANHLS
ncbi:hypothetical protein N7G274_010691 [Stereocaulon virgatum]|uniref:Uncharacterized protein n=1 Tax=Stereocaulon virgatum TaxID=373712 RepID=A0ABR3ZU53_9LECA